MTAHFNSEEVSLRLMEAWKRLREVSHLHFTSVKHLAGKEQHVEGRGSVDVQHEASILIFSERGSWSADEGTHYQFSNRLRWSLNQDKGVITLEHLRYGEQHPVLLLDLAPVGRLFKSESPHLCGQDTYFGQLVLHANSVELMWRILGPKKREEISYTYS